MKWLINFLCKNSVKEKTTETLKKEIDKERKRDMKNLRRINKQVKVVLAQANIEVIITNVKGVMREIK